MESLCLNTPLGDITVFEHRQRVVALDWGRGHDSPRSSKNPLLKTVRSALESYFRGQKTDFSTLPLDLVGSAFQCKVWKEMQAIEFGCVKTYGQIAEILGSSPRAVGSACGANPVPIIVPCHRVIAQNALGGYTGGNGIDTKTHLLRLEGYLKDSSP